MVSIPGKQLCCCMIESIVMWGRCLSSVRFLAPSWYIITYIIIMHAWLPWSFQEIFWCLLWAYRVISWYIFVGTYTYFSNAMYKLNSIRFITDAQRTSLVWSTIFHRIMTVLLLIFKEYEISLTNSPIAGLAHRSGIATSAAKSLNFTISSIYHWLFIYSSNHLGIVKIWEPCGLKNEYIPITFNRLADSVLYDVQKINPGSTLKILD